MTPAKRRANAKWRGKNREYAVEYQRKYRTPERRARRNEQERASRSRNPRRYKDTQLRRRYGIGIAAYEDMLSAQNNRCAVCGLEPSRWHVDHCHKTRKVRALLCAQCNSGLGLFRDNPSALRAAARYVEYHSRRGSKRK